MTLPTMNRAIASLVLAAALAGCSTATTPPLTLAGKIGRAHV